MDRDINKYTAAKSSGLKQHSITNSLFEFEYIKTNEKVINCTRMLIVIILYCILKVLTIPVYL